MKPFLLLTHRPEDEEALRERVDVARFSGIDVEHVDQRRVDQQPLGQIELDHFSGVLVGGGPFNVTEPVKHDLQLRAEAEILDVTARCIEQDFPYFGLCYGMGILGLATGGVVDRQYPESPGTPIISLTPEGRVDPLLADTPDQFPAFTGHKEAVSKLGRDVVLLASGDESPNQLVRVKTNVYAAQFHPELDTDSLVARLIAYRSFGYFPDSEFEQVISWARSTDIGTTSNDLLAAFVRRFARD